MPVELRRRILARQLVRQSNWHLVLLIAPPHRSRRLDLLAQVLEGRTRNGDNAVFAALGRADDQLRGLQVHVLDPQIERLVHAHAATVEQPHGQACGKSGVALDGLKQLPGFLRRRGVANLDWPSGPQRLDVFQLRPQGLFVEEDNCIKGLILGAGGDILLGQDGQKPFQFMFTWQMQREPFEEVAISPEPGAVSALGCECKMLASNNFRKPPHRFVGIHLAIVIHEQPVVYQLLGHIRAMKIIPASGSEWFALFLLPFKVFVPGGWLMLAIKRGIVGYRMDNAGDLIMIVVAGYFLSFIVLVLGAMIQHSIGPRRAYLSTCGFIVALFVFGFLTLPYLAHT